ncbi:sigma factor-binding protein Crl [Vibrio sp. SCSIO 43136]|uniref:sigma factor-binding protein Crl n=1 Tax=Vibrio sp. SCSIO 43136 TaxID=2819101 RepID=UPI00207526C8|nr:sigma factor-binding protein Crl [Vibrio sp. SCSIO 43136]USD65860.1 sigma factor-binding protein Crl [Vibrio sp. SCSIO 43136]
MSETTPSPTHHRLLATFKAVGPYLREPLSSETSYLFDCLSVCVDEKQSPEVREFWGWWMEFEPEDNGFTARFRFGLYNQEGDWVEQEIPAEAKEEVNKTRNAFEDKLTKALSDKFGLFYQLHDESTEAC